MTEIDEMRIEARSQENDGAGVTYPGRLSELQKKILRIIANDTINIMECRESEERYEVYIPPGHQFKSHDLMDDGSIKYSRALSKTCEEYWGEDVVLKVSPFGDTNHIINNKHRVAFSNSVHNLVEKKGLVDAYALAWVNIGQAPNGQLMESRACYQGGGRKKTECWDGYESKKDRPRYKLLYLSSDGWNLARELFDDRIGMCEILAKKIKEQEGA